MSNCRMCQPLLLPPRRILAQLHRQRPLPRRRGIIINTHVQFRQGTAFVKIPRIFLAPALSTTWRGSTPPTRVERRAAHQYKRVGDAFTPLQTPWRSAFAGAKQSPPGTMYVWELLLYAYYISREQICVVAGITVWNYQTSWSIFLSWSQLFPESAYCSCYNLVAKPTAL